MELINRNVSQLAPGVGRHRAIRRSSDDVGRFPTIETGASSERHVDPLANGGHIARAAPSRSNLTANSIGLKYSVKVRDFSE